MSKSYPEVTTPAYALPTPGNTKPEFPKACPVCGACVVETSTEWCRETARYACGGAYTSKPQIQNHTLKWWGSCKGNAETFAKVKTIKQIRADPRVEELWNEGADGWWASLVDGYRWDLDLHCIHEQTIREVAEVLNGSVDRCSADCQCKQRNTSTKVEVTAAN